MGTVNSADTGKRAAAEAAVEMVESGMHLGLGTGSTVQFALEALARRIRDDKLRVACVPTSVRTEQEARRLGITLTDFSACAELDLAIDGADEVQNGTLALIKGLGGALLREKIVAVNSRRFIVIADASKLVTVLGSRAPVPVEVVQFGVETVVRRLTAIGARPVLRHDAAGAPIITDGGNLILDCHDLAPITDAAALDQTIRTIAGVVETGLFPRIADQAIIADGAEWRILHRLSAT